MKMYAWFMSYTKIAHYRVVTWYNGSFLLKAEVLTPNRNGFMAKTCYFPL